MSTAPTLLVTGAAGHLGRRVVDLLLERGVAPARIVAATRSPDKLADLAARGVVVRRADFDQPAFLDGAFAGVDRLLLISTDSLDRPGARLAQHKNAVAAAIRAGVRHVVYTSAPKASADSVISITPDHYGTEQALAASTLGYTVLRNNLYAELFLATLPRAVATGQLVTATGEGRAAYLSREDCARAAAGALVDGFEGRRTLEVTGPEALSQNQLAALLTEITGKPVAHVAIPRAALEAGMVQAGLPAPVATVFASFDEGISRGELDVVTSVVADLAGSPAEDMRSFLGRHRGALLGAA